MAKKAKQAKKGKTRFIVQARSIKKVRGKAASVAKSLRGKFKTRSAAHTALKPAFAKVYTGKTTTPMSGHAKGEALNAHNALRYLLDLMFPKKHKAHDNKRKNIRTATHSFLKGRTKAQLRTIKALVIAAYNAA